MTDMPQMIAIYNGMGGGAAGTIAAIEMLKQSSEPSSLPLLSLAVLGAVIGTVSFSGSAVAFAKLEGWMQRTLVLPKHQLFNLLLTAFAGYLSVHYLQEPSSMVTILAFFSVLLVLGVALTLPIGGANMPVVISLFNAMTGLAVGFEGFVLNNAAMIIAGTVVGASGTLLTQLMAKAMNQSVLTILFRSAVAAGPASEMQGTQKPVEAPDAAIALAYAQKVIFIPGYGLAVAQAQHKLWELVQLLKNRSIDVKFAIHPVAGRMPGHMNVLLAEAGVPYDIISI